MKHRLSRHLSRMGLSVGEQSGQLVVWTAVMLPLFLSVIGLAADGGIAFGARRELQNVADSAARAGAMQVDQRVVSGEFWGDGGGSTRQSLGRWRPSMCPARGQRSWRRSRRNVSRWWSR